MYSFCKMSAPHRNVAWVLMVSLLMIVMGCTSTRQQILAQDVAGKSGDRQEALEALHSMTEAVSGKDVSQQDMVDLARDIDQNEEAATAVKAITDSLQGEGISYKYCPICGKRYHPKFTYCPLHHVLLKDVEE